ncbi:hypothetical protein OAB57_02430 [Bacteriovoracaceae bacterium]|nr:hypothetical protein [Bacteriovoracaceae bacterium]
MNIICGLFAIFFLINSVFGKIDEKSVVFIDQQYDAETLNELKNHYSDYVCLSGVYGKEKKKIQSDLKEVYPYQISSKPGHFKKTGCTFDELFVKNMARNPPGVIECLKRKCLKKNWLSFLLSRWNPKLTKCLHNKCYRSIDGRMKTRRKCSKSTVIATYGKSSMMLSIIGELWLRRVATFFHEGDAGLVLFGRRQFDESKKGFFDLSHHSTYWRRGGIYQIVNNEKLGKLLITCNSFSSSFQKDLAYAGNYVHWKGEYRYQADLYFDFLKRLYPNGNIVALGISRNIESRVVLIKDQKAVVKLKNGKLWKK